MYKQYKNSEGNVVNFAIIRTTDGACIPFDPQNSDYIAYLKWIEEGNVPTPADD